MREGVGESAKGRLLFELRCILSFNNMERRLFAAAVGGAGTIYA